MTMPTHAAVALWRDAAAATSHPVGMPAGITAGQLLLCVFSADGSTTCTPSAGWEALGQQSYATTVTGAVFWRIAAGGDTLTVETGSSVLCSAITHSINDARAVLGVASNGSSANSAPPPLAPFLGATDVLWLVSRSGDSTTVATAAPSGWGNLQSRSGYNTSAASTNTARLSQSSAGVSPGTFTSSSEQWVCWTLAVYDGVQQAGAEVPGPMGTAGGVVRAVDGVRGSVSGPLGAAALAVLQPSGALVSVPGPLGAASGRARPRGRPLPAVTQAAAAEARRLLSDPLPLRRADAVPGYKSDALLPWVYGRVRVELQQIDEAGLLWLVADHAIVGVSAVLVGETLIDGWQLVQGLDASGHPCAWVRLTQIPDGAVGADVIGRPHRITGAALEHPADIAEDLLAHCGWSPEADGAFRPWAAAWPGVAVGGVFGDTVTVRDAVSQVAASIDAEWSASPFLAWARSDGVVSASIGESDCLEATATATHDGLANVLRVSYARDHHAQEWGGTTTVRAQDRVEAVGELVADLDLPWVRTERDALAVSAAYLQCRARPRLVYEIRVPSEARYSPGDIVAINLPWVPAVTAVIIRVQRSRSDQTVVAEAWAGDVPAVSL